METALFLLASVFAAVGAVPRNPQRIVGGNLTTIEQYPFASPLLYTPDDVVYNQICGGTVINTQSILTAAHCPYGDLPNKWRVRVGSTYANSGGRVHEVALLILHPNYVPDTGDNDIAIMRIINPIILGDIVQPGAVAGTNYALNDGEPVRAIGWGSTSAEEEIGSEQLRDVLIWVVNQETCRTNYAELGRAVTDNMLCSGWIDVGGRDQCQGDSGGPLLHNNVVVGICSWGYQCALPKYPGVNTRVSRYTLWIQLNA